MSELQVACLRQGDWFVCVKGGHNAESHNHNDVGSFSLYFDGAPVLCDVGIGTYTKQTFSDRRYEIPWVRSLTHNIPEINGQEQKHGREFRADSFIADDGGVKVSYAGAYRADAGVSSAVREYSLTDSGLVFTENFSFTSDKKQVREALVTAIEVKIEDGSVILGGKYRITASKGVPTTEFISFEGDKKLIKPWKTDGVTKISFDIENAEAFTLKIEKI
jgi:hypothetical protein